MLRLSDISRAKLLGKLLRLPLRAVPAGMVVPVLQGPLRGAKWICGSFTNGCWLGSYEGDKVQKFADSIAEGSVVFDIGAAVGYYSLIAARRVGKNGKVVAFEPLPRNLEYLRKHVAYNNASSVEIVAGAVGENSGTATFKLGSNYAMGSVAQSGDFTVPMYSLDEFITRSGIAPPAVVKIDVEGGEFGVLKGARHLLQSARPKIFLATHGEAVHRDCCGLLLSFGYALHPLDAADLAGATEVLAVG